MKIGDYVKIKDNVRWFVVSDIMSEDKTLIRICRTSIDNAAFSFASLSIVSSMILYIFCFLFFLAFLQLRYIQVAAFTGQGPLQS